MNIKKQNYLVSVLFIAIWGIISCGTKYKGTSTLSPPNLGLKANIEQINIDVHYIIQPNGVGSWVKDAGWTEVGFSITNTSSTNITISQIRLVNEKGVFLTQGTSPAELTKISEEIARATAEGAATEAAIMAAPTSVILSPVFGPLTTAVAMLPNMLRSKDREQIEAEFRKRQIAGGTTLAPKGSIKASGFFPITSNPQKLAFSLQIDEENKEIEVSLSQTTPSETQKQSTQPEKKQVASTTKAKQDNIKDQKDLLLKIQQKLTELGYNPGPADGVMGNKTKTALKQYQKDKGLAETGEINPATLASLGIKE